MLIGRDHDHTIITRAQSESGLVEKDRMSITSGITRRKRRGYKRPARHSLEVIRQDEGGWIVKPLNLQRCLRDANDVA